MTADALADHIVALFNALTTLPITVQAVKPAEIAEIDSERDDCGVYVVPKDENEEAIGDAGSTCKRTRVVSVAINGPVRDALTLTVYTELSELLRTSLEGTEFARHVWDRNETISLWDRDALKNRRRFLALFETTYANFS